MRQLSIHPPLLNSSNPWCSDIDQLRELYNCPYTGAVTTRTSLLDGFPNDPSMHQHAFFNPSTHNATFANPSKAEEASQTGSLNTLGYSPRPLKEYLAFIKTISDELPETAQSNSPNPSHFRSNGLKPILISVTGDVDEVVECYQQICAHQRIVRMVLAMEVNLSCPNIPGKPPPAYDAAALLSYLAALKLEVANQVASHSPGKYGAVHVPIGIKTPPYTYHDQFKQLVDALVGSAKELEPKTMPCPISFITATNTLGSSLLLTPTLEKMPSSPADGKPWEVFHHTLNSANGSGVGGLAGAPLHPLALGNVYTIKGMLFQHSELEHVQIIGVGGVDDAEGYQRMRAVGAAAVGLGTALGRKGVRIFEEIGRPLEQAAEQK